MQTVAIRLAVPYHRMINSHRAVSSEIANTLL
jgi:hypothetical protein